MTKSLSHEELRILCFIRRRGPVSMKQCLKKFGNDARPRIEYLFGADYIEHAYKPDTLHSLGLVSTTKGRNALQDSRWANYVRLRDSVLVPIFVSFFTALVAPDIWLFIKPFLRTILEALL